jgi:hypothetical protein
MQDDLFKPTIREQRAPETPPWRPESILYPAFFGGPLAATTLGVINGTRLGLPGRKLLVIAAAGLAAIGGRLAVTAAVDGNSGVRLAGSVAGALVWLVVLALQRKPFRAYTFRDTEPASLTGPGIAAALGCGILEVILILVLVR